MVRKWFLKRQIIYSKQILFPYWSCRPFSFFGYFLERNSLQFSNSIVILIDTEIENEAKYSGVQQGNENQPCWAMCDASNMNN